MRIIKSHEASDAGTDGSETFAGTGFIRHLHDWTNTGTERLSVVTFVDGGRTHWHKHAGGQLLVVTAGHGLVAIRDQPAVQIGVGDLVIAEPGEQHWHGAVSGSQLTHLAVSRGLTTWFEPAEPTCKQCEAE